MLTFKVNKRENWYTKTSRSKKRCRKIANTIRRRRDRKELQ